MGDDWEGTWGDARSWEEHAPAEPLVTAPTPTRRTTGRSWVIVLAFVVVVLAGLVVTSGWGGDDSGTHAFTHTRSDGVTPVGYDPCTPIRIAVNPRTGPAQALDLVGTAADLLAEASGLDLVVVGLSDEPPVSGEDRQAPPRGAQVLVAWTDPEETPGLAGSALGHAGSAVWWVKGGSPEWYSYGQAALDGPALSGRSDAFVVGVITHELGHVLGLAHVNDYGEIMHPTAGGNALGPGDRQGLAVLGALPCRSGKPRT